MLGSGAEHAYLHALNSGARIAAHLRLSAVLFTQDVVAVRKKTHFRLPNTIEVGAAA